MKYALFFSLLFSSSAFALSQGVQDMIDNQIQTVSNDAYNQIYAVIAQSAQEVTKQLEGLQTQLANISGVYSQQMAQGQMGLVPTPASL